MFVLIQGVSTTLQPDIVSNETAAEAWQAMKDCFDKDPQTPILFPSKSVLLKDFKIGQSIIVHTTNFENPWNRLATWSKQATDKKESYLYSTKLSGESEEFEGAVYLASLMDTYRHLYNPLAAREQPNYIDIRDFFISLAAEKSETNEGDKSLFVTNQKTQKTRECTWCRARGFKSDN